MSRILSLLIFLHQLPLELLINDDPAPHLRLLKVRRDVTDDEVFAWFSKGETRVRIQWGYRRITQENATVGIIDERKSCVIGLDVLWGYTWLIDGHLMETFHVKSHGAAN